MNKIIKRALLTVSVLGVTSGAALADYTLTIMHINDWHSRIESNNKYESTCSAEDETKGECFGGAARLVTAINQMREKLKDQNVILLNGGDKSAVATGLYRDLALAACDAIGGPVPLGSRGAGFGATTATLRGGHGSASANTGRYTVAALAAVNAAGSATIGDSARFWAAAYERDGEFGGLGLPGAMPPQALVARTKGMAAASTTLCVVATDAALTKVQARRLAVMAQDGLARALHPVHTPLDGDVVFALATGRIPLADPLVDLVAIGSEAAHCLARAVARGVHAADSSVGTAMPPAWKDKFG